MGVIFVTSVFWETTMSNFNDANELASNLVFGTSYHNNKPMEGERPKQLSFHLTRRVTITADANTHEESGQGCSVRLRNFSTRGSGSTNPTAPPARIPSMRISQPTAHTF